MTPKQKATLEYIWINGGYDCTALSSQVLRACQRAGWIEVDDDDDQNDWGAYGDTFNECEWRLTDSGRLALHEASQ